MWVDGLSGGGNFIKRANDVGRSIGRPESEVVSVPRCSFRNLPLLFSPAADFFAFHSTAVFSRNHYVNRRKIMKTTKLSVTGILTAVSLVLTCISSRAYVGPTNFMAYNFDTCPGWPYLPVWTAGGENASVQCNPQDSSNNPASGSMQLMVNYQGGQWFLMDGGGYTPSNSNLPLSGVIRFTNLQFDVKYYSAAPGLIRTNVSPWDFGSVRVGSIGRGFAEYWFGYYAVPATNGLGQPNTDWVHINIDLSQVPTQYPGLAADGLHDIEFNQDDSALSGTQLIWFDNIFFTGWVSPPPPVIMSVTMTGNTVSFISTNAVATFTYQLQYTTSLNPTNWVDVGSAQVANSTMVTNTDTSATDAVRFYQVRVQ